jgi:hypothetical protein
MKIRLTLPLCAVLLLAAVLGFFYSRRMKMEAFKGEQMKQTQKQPQAAKPQATKPQATKPQATKPQTIKPQATKLSITNSAIGKQATINTGANTITIPGMGTQPIKSSSCDSHGVCSYTIPDGQTITVYKNTVTGISQVQLGPSGKPIPGPEPAPAPAPSPAPSGTQSTIKATPAPFMMTLNAITCPNGEQSTTGCCANGEPQGKYPCCADGTPSRNGQCK